MTNSIQVLTPDWSEYELLDSGDQRKLERFGAHILIRSEPKAWWRPDLPESAWKKAAAVFDDTNGWTFARAVPSEWPLRFDQLTLLAKATHMSKHVGVFPEQSPHWRWMQQKIHAAKSAKNRQLLNLFGYTGAASLIAAANGLQVTHVDASKPALAWGQEQQRLSKLEQSPVRWLLDDALKFVKREIRRERRYDAILLDPPSFGRGPKKEVWKVEKNLVELLDNCRQILSAEPLFIILTLYSLEASSLMIGNLLTEMMADFKGRVTIGELALPHSQSKKVLPLSLFGRWESGG